MDRLQPLAQHLDDEGFGAALRHRPVEAEQIEIVDADGVELAQLDAEGRQAEGRLVGLEIGPRMRLEGEHAAGRVELARQAQRLADHLLMAEMQPVEIAQRDDGAARFDRDLGVVPEQTHGGKI